jgi:hypothetical protein
MVLKANTQKGTASVYGKAGKVDSQLHFQSLEAQLPGDWGWVDLQHHRDKHRRATLRYSDPPCRPRSF